MPVSAIRDRVFSFLKDNRIRHLQRRKHPFTQKISIRLPRNFRHNQSEHDISGIAVIPFRSRCKLPLALFFQQRQHFRILNLLLRTPNRASRLFRRIHQIFVVRQSARMIQKLTHRYLFSVLGKLRENPAELRFVAQFLVLHEQHDCHRRELLSHRREPKVGFRINLRQASELPYSVSALKDDFSVLLYQHRQARSFVCRKPFKDARNLLLRRLALRFHVRRHQHPRHQPYPQRPQSHTPPPTIAPAAYHLPPHSYSRNTRLLSLFFPDQAKRELMARVALDDPRYYFNRHIQWLEFNRRVLEEARDIGNPLLERVKFLAITANNLDEFVEVRVSSFLQEIEQGTQRISPDGLTVEQELEQVSTAMHLLVRDQYKCWNEELIPALAKESIRVLRMDELDAKSLKAAKAFYDRRLNPMLTPVAVDPSHPFPHVLNKVLCIAFLLRRRRGGSGKPYFGVVTVPRALPRLLRMPSESGNIHYVFLQDVLSHYAARLYRGYEILASAAFRITRNSNLYLQEEETRNLLETIDSQVALRRKGDAVRLEIEAGAHNEIVDRLVSTFELDESLVFRVDGPVNLQRLFHVYEESPRPDLKFPAFA